MPDSLGWISNFCLRWGPRKLLSTLRLKPALSRRADGRGSSDNKPLQSRRSPANRLRNSANLRPYLLDTTRRILNESGPCLIGTTKFLMVFSR